MEAQNIPPKPKLVMGFGSGQPNAPRGEPEFSPLNPWGRAMPAPPRPEKRTLYQVVVRDMRDGNKEKRIGPAMEGPEGAELLRLTIANQIQLGREKAWHTPRVIAVLPDMGKPVPFLGG